MLLRPAKSSGPTLLSQKHIETSCDHSSYCSSPINDTDHSTSHIPSYDTICFQSSRATRPGFISDQSGQSDNDAQKSTDVKRQRSPIPHPGFSQYRITKDTSEVLSEASQATSTGLGSSDSVQRRLREPGNLNHLAHPLRPPFSPPSRVKTPPGVPRWPENLMRHVSITNEASILAAGQTRMVQRRQSIGSRLGGLLRTRDEHDIWYLDGVNRQPWRATASGHSTSQFTSLTAHPFNNARISESTQPHRPDLAPAPISTNSNRLIHSPTTSEHRLTLVPETRNSETTSGKTGAGRPAAVDSTDHGTNNPMTSQNALRAAYGNAIWVSPRRVSVKAATRSVALPPNRRPPTIAPLPSREHLTSSESSQAQNFQSGADHGVQSTSNETSQTSAVSSHPPAGAFTAKTERRKVCPHTQNHLRSTPRSSRSWLQSLNIGLDSGLDGSIAPRTTDMLPLSPPPPPPPPPPQAPPLPSRS